MPSSSERVLLRNGTILAPAHPGASALVSDGERVTWIGDDATADQYAVGAARTVDLGGALVTPGFVDAHVHLSKTGFALQSVDLGAAGSLTEALELIEHQAQLEGSTVLFAHGWDESRWPEARPFTAAELDRVVGDRVAYISRVDAHSAVVSSALLRQDPTITTRDGWRGGGLVARDAHHAARNVVDTLRSLDERREALLRALRHAANRGITTVHEINAPHISRYDDLDLIGDLLAGQVLPDVVSYWGEFMGGKHADDPRLAGFAGDLCVDGAIGSRTAALTTSYADADSGGNLYLDDVAVRDHVIWCTEHGTQAGFHVIGDRGVDTVLAGLSQAADKVGVDAMVGARHRLEHVEMIQPVGVALLARLGLVASVQPAFDAAWGGPGALYEQRLGASRAAPMNPFASMHRAGVRLAFGSDSPVTPLDPWAGVRAAVWHCNENERLTASVAFDAHTRGGHLAAGDESAGVLAVGGAATYAVWETASAAVVGGGGLLTLDATSPLPKCVRTVVSGAVAYDVMSAS